MTDSINRQDILLESGTNEMEIMEFYLGSQSFGINVHKLREIVPFNQSQLTVLPESLPSIVGSLLIRGKTMPLIDLNLHLRRAGENDVEEERRQIVLICEFNNSTNGFLVDGVNQIHRVSWQNVQPLSSYIEQYRPRFTGSIEVEKREVLIIDLEHIMSEIDPAMAMAYDNAIEGTPPEDKAHSGLSTTERRQKVKLMLAEDSSVIRAGIIKVLSASGYDQLTTYVDGQECHDAIVQIKKDIDRTGEDISDHLNLLITDIEMPKMDGLTLCRKVKEELGLKEMTVLIFSSLVNDQMILKCDSVGADGYVTKPQIPELVALLDGFCL